MTSGQAPVVVKFGKIFINNQFVDSANGKTYPVINPYTTKKICDVQEGSKADIDKAVQACKLAFKRGTPWRRMDASRRGHLLYRLADLFERDIAHLSSLETLNTGKPYKNSYQDMVHSIQILRYFAGWADKNMGQNIPVDGDFFSVTKHEPVGICGLIIPWNYPMVMMTCKMAPALSCGNCVVIKPAEQTPLTALHCASLVKEAGFPPGVVNVVPGYGTTCGQSISSHQDINKVSFTGSTEVGKLVMQAAGSSNLKRCSLELSGKCPLVVFPDTDLDFAVQQAHEAAFENMGQCRWSGARTYVHESIYEEFIKRSVELATRRKIGDPYELETEHGPQIDEEQYNKVIDYIKSAQEQGAKLKYGGNKHGDKGYYIEPTVFSEVSDNMKIVKEEIFGPVQLLMKFRDLDEVIDRCNQSDYGMAAAIFTNDVNRIMTFTNSVNTGTVWVNTYHYWFPQAPFGGYKTSGISREMGKYALREYTEVKSVSIWFHLYYIYIA
ncbi:Full=Omega-crystallin [Octopus vulgaris]|uniref:Omega-crystallin n=1 Tax=Octopus vulgaris TaxID=6645 RepID=A0AA36BAV8_OCTVU|nr:Full=Omega-crystallin [Octopus vulgaris]